MRKKQEGSFKKVFIAAVLLIKQIHSNS